LYKHLRQVYIVRDVEVGDQQVTLRKRQANGECHARSVPIGWAGRAEWRTLPDVPLGDRRGPVTARMHPRVVEWFAP
jgi:hypothetical protein